MLHSTDVNNVETAYSAVILYFCSPKTICATVESVINQVHPPSEIVIVDNHSCDELDQVLQGSRLKNKVQVVRTPRNLGYGGGMNWGVSKLSPSARNILFLTHEVRLAADCSRGLLQGLVDYGFAATGPKLLLPDGRPWSIGGTAGCTGDAWHRDIRADSPAACDWLDGAAIMVPKGTFVQAGGFDESFFLYWEDVEFGLRLRSSSGRPVACIQSVFAHQDTQLTPAYYYARNRLLLWRRRETWPKFVSSVVALVLYKNFRDILRLDWAQVCERCKAVRHGLTGVTGEKPR